MSPPFEFYGLPGRRVIKADDSDRVVSLEQEVRSLEEEVFALQMLICQLLEKNERLRTRLRACEVASMPWNSVN